MLSMLLLHVPIEIRIDQSGLPPLYKVQIIKLANGSLEHRAIPLLDETYLGIFLFFTGCAHAMSG
jgi:hypothetical protein